ncbi:MAG: hypothetical protein EP329_14285 [Deltaproteobacteria bacterium]|nr:MAG: hypothetical protein EP329_14285 [Deltaproteobacteria bacterium]
MRIHATLILLTALVAACAHREAATVTPTAPETPVRLLPLAGGAADVDEEISGLAWHGDDLVLLPERLGLEETGHRLVPGPQHVWVLDRATVTRAIAGDPTPLTPRAVPVTPDLAAWRPGEVDGFEAITFDGDTAWLLVETYQNDAGDNPGWLVRGHLGADGLTLDLAGARPLPRPTAHANSGYETVFRWRDGVCAVYELNAAALVPAPRARCFDAALRPAPDLPVPPLPWRVTDATERDDAGRLWVINYRYPGSREIAPEPADEALVRRFGAGATHARFAQVERLVAWDVGDDGARLADRAPIQLQLPADWGDRGARNWEGIVRAPGGFLLVTDEHPGPTTLLAFVPAPRADSADQENARPLTNP